jgi:NAD(P)H dehydrogenase (quinone)
MTDRIHVVGVTGATGRLGGRIARRLAEAGVNQRLLVRDPARAPRLAGASVAQAAFGDREAVVASLAGVPTVLMVSASETPDRVAQHTTFIDAATEAGSSTWCTSPSTAPLPTRRSLSGETTRDGGAHPRLRDVLHVPARNFYADFMPALVGDDGVIRGPAGHGLVAAVAQDDSPMPRPLCCSILRPMRGRRTP